MSYEETGIESQKYITEYNNHKVIETKISKIVLAEILIFESEKASKYFNKSIENITMIDVINYIYRKEYMSDFMNYYKSMEIQ